MNAVLKGTDGSNWSVYQDKDNLVVVKKDKETKYLHSFSQPLSSKSMFKILVSTMHENNCDIERGQ